MRVQIHHTCPIGSCGSAHIANGAKADQPWLAHGVGGGGALSENLLVRSAHGAIGALARGGRGAFRYICTVSKRVSTGSNAGHTTRTPALPTFHKLVRTARWASSADAVRGGTAVLGGVRKARSTGGAGRADGVGGLGAGAGSIVVGGTHGAVGTLGDQAAEAEGAGLAGTAHARLGPVALGLDDAAGGAGGPDCSSVQRRSCGPNAILVDASVCGASS